ncbi:MAG: 4'-phosphopantetheinyl transferase superfamily protein [Xanthomonadaceae bacterium]|nr:4'-phosphopantetheinyl transferase superfamily protein [Xanthomonadaceae bacterium]MDE1964188.1 4'-phosphopantetheinyl transferase superfamily protein [Xanthomonadaceae bacterium]
MSDPPRSTLMKLAEPLGEDEIHLWSGVHRPESGRAPLRALLARYLGVSPDEVVLGEEAHGRPVIDLPRAAGLFFNWTHSHGRVLVAVARNVRPGVDLESVLRRRPDVVALARRFFDPAEAAAIERCDPPQGLRCFLRIWCCKEALLKAHGRGLGFGMDRVSVTLEAAGPRIRTFADEQPEAWQLVELAQDDGWVAALAWRGEPRRLVWRGGLD